MLIYTYVRTQEWDRHERIGNTVTDPGDSMIARLAATITGNPTGDPLSDAMSAVIMVGVKRVAEMNEVGFDTNAIFSLDYLNECLAQHKAFVVTSLSTNTRYLVAVQKCMGSSFRVAVQVYHESKVNKDFYEMTLVRAANGSIRANPGW